GRQPRRGIGVATRSGTSAPGRVLWLQRHGGLETDEVARVLESESGLAGLSGMSGGDMRDVLAARARGDGAAALAFDAYVHRLRRELGGMIAVLGGLDVLVFTGGVGEHAAEVRAAACEALGFAGISVDRRRNASLSREGEISGVDTRARTFVVTAREDIEIARQVRARCQRPPSS